MMSFITHIVMKLQMAFVKKTLWDPLIKKTHDVASTQNKLLSQILKQNKNTDFGRQHNFSNITSYEEFKHSVPVCNYESLRPYFEKQEACNQSYMNTKQVIMYVQTSGSTSKPKLIPILKHTFSQYRKNQHIVAYAIYAAIPNACQGKILAIVSPAIEGRLKTGISYGSMSGIIHQSMPAFMRKKYVVPIWVFDIKDYEEKYYFITKYALSEKNISMIATANPSTLIKLNTIINQKSKELIKDIKINNPRRADELQQILYEKNVLTFADVWKNLKSVTTWTGGSCAIQISNLEKYLAPSTNIVEMGYLSSEFRGSMTVDVINNQEIPTINENFFEFVAKDDYENETPKFLTLDEVEKGKQYYIFATTQNGLYRYDIHDIVEITGKFNDTPTIHFIQKGKSVTNLTGEKLHEAQLMQAMQELKKIYCIDFQFFIMLGSPENIQYTLYIEHEPLNMPDIEKIFNQLNIEYEAKLKSGRLQSLNIIFIKDGTGEKYKQHVLKTGQREGQFKMMHLQYTQNCSFDFNHYIRK